MAVIQGKGAFKKILYAPVTILLLAIICALLATSVYDLYQKKKHTEAAKQEVEQQLQQLQEQKDRLEKKLGTLSTQEGIETVVREKEAVIRPGEQVVIVQEEIATTTESGNKSWWARLWGWVVSIF